MIAGFKASKLVAKHFLTELPQTLPALTHTLPMVGVVAKFTVAEVVPCPLTIVALGETVQV